MAESTFYKNYPSDVRNRLDEVAQALRRRPRIQALKKMDSELMKSLNTLMDLRDTAKSEFVRFQSAKTLIEFVIGTPMQRVDHTSKGESINVQVTYADGNNRDYA